MATSGGASLTRDSIDAAWSAAAWEGVIARSVRRSPGNHATSWPTFAIKTRMDRSNALADDHHAKYIRTRCITNGDVMRLDEAMDQVQCD